MTQLVDPTHVKVRPKVYPYTTTKRDRSTGARTQRTRYKVKWRVAGYDRTWTADKSSQAEDFRLQLVSRLSGPNRQRFDTVTGLPEDLLPNAGGHTLLAAAQALIAEEWADWSPGNKRARVEALADHVACHTPDRGHPGREVARRVARDHLLPPPDAQWEYADTRVGDRVVPEREMRAAAAWLERQSLLVSELADVVKTRDLLTRTAVAPDGTPYGPDTRQRSRSSLSLLCLWAVERKELATNPVALAKRRIADDSANVDPDFVPSLAEARELIAAACDTSDTARWQYLAFFTLIALTGMRPSEAAGLKNNRDLPAEGWGTITLRTPMVHTGSRWTSTGEHYQDQTKLKARKRGETRLVQVPPEAVQALREHLVEHETKRGDRVFVNTNGQPIDPSSMSKVWRKGRARACDASFDGLTVYELRHTAASAMLRAGIPVPDVAAQLGNSPATLMRVYARVLGGGAEAFRARMDEVLTED